MFRRFERFPRFGLINAKISKRPPRNTFIRCQEQPPAIGIGVDSPFMLKLTNVGHPNQCNISAPDIYVSYQFSV